MSEDFEGFWAMYPRRIGKLAAMKAYQKARVVATADEILAGVETYLQHLPEDIKYVPHPSTWLNQGRWADEFDPLPKVQKKSTLAMYQPYKPAWRRASGG